jgi:CRISPR-associated endonuclease Cas1
MLNVPFYNDLRGIGYRGYRTYLRNHGVVTLHGYGISARVDRGHLILEDGVGPRRRLGRFARIGHGLERIAVIGAEGAVSLAALRWIAAQNAALVMLDRDGSVLTTIGPVRSSDSRLRRAQSLAHHSGAAIEISRGLISQKLEGQGRIVRDEFNNSPFADRIDFLRSELTNSNSIEAIRQIEAVAAKLYWSVWRDLPVRFPTADYPRVPQHWCSFGTRKSALTGSPRLATNPPNAMLNYMYALLESESRLAASAVGLDPGIGVLHVDTDARDSLACDLMEAVRPHVDAYLFKWLVGGLLRRDWFFELPNGNCRLMAPFVERLSQSLPVWARIVAPTTEWVAKRLWSATSRVNKLKAPATCLTQTHRRSAKRDSDPPISGPEGALPLCQTCGRAITAGHRYCSTCSIAISARELVKGAQQGRLASHSEEAQASRSEKGRSNTTARWAWRVSNQSNWISEQTYSEKVRPRLEGIPVRIVASALGVSLPYASNVRSGKRKPHERHWLTLAQLANIQEP